MLIKAGVDGKQTVFLFSDNQIKEESFVEDINMILNTGDVPNIFPADEKADVIEKMQTVARVEVRKNKAVNKSFNINARAPEIICEGHLVQVYTVFFLDT